MKAEQVKQFLKDKTGRDDDFMEEPWEFQTLEDLVDFMMQWEDHYTRYSAQDRYNKAILYKKPFKEGSSPGFTIKESELIMKLRIASGIDQ